MRRPVYIGCMAFLLPALSALGQITLVNYDANVYVQPNTYMVVQGSVLNEVNGTFDNSGTISLTGNWTNNAGNAAFVNSSPGLAVLNGASQQIGGSDPTRFYGLSLQGTGIKSQAVDALVEDSLALNDRELATNDFTMYVLNGAGDAISRAGTMNAPFTNAANEGFVSSTGNGSLARIANVFQPYVFPVGSSLGTMRFRPVEAMLTNAFVDTIHVRLANVDATGEGYDRDMRENLCEINPFFYHRIWSGFGDAMDLTIHYDELSEPGYTTLAHWQNLPQWEDMAPVAQALNTSPVLSTITKTGWADYSFPAFALAKPGPLSFADAGNDTTIALGSSVQLNGSGGANYNWTPPDFLTCTACQSPLATPTQTTTWYLTVTDAAGCNTMDSVTVIVDESCTYFVPNVFSPNGDGNNDELRVRGGGFTLSSFLIYDRWGRKIFETGDVTAGWDGTTKSQRVDPGVYVYHLEGTCLTGGQVFEKGNVTLVR